ncbi:hypothetical protein Q7C36_003571 [Tachysurus vachellii]|uniref:Uncharacterized protein n=1 Tax=Tachysurus vachellii TaxID=175792 RepID=A0AA88T541_TACVA|nr:hypothetical protein Q7C36_003571 [Tachysurus vachellii]
MGTCPQMSLSTSTTNGDWGSGWWRSGAAQNLLRNSSKASCASGVQERALAFPRRRDVSGVVDLAETPNEPAVEVCKTQKSMELLDRGGNQPVPHCIHLPLVHPDTCCADVVSQELYFQAVELALGEVEVQPVFPQQVKDFGHMVVMVLLSP